MRSNFCLESQAKFREVVSFDKHVLLKKLRDVLESLRGRVAGRNKDDVEEAISMVSFLVLVNAQTISVDGSIGQLQTSISLAVSVCIGRVGVGCVSLRS